VTMRRTSCVFTPPTIESLRHSTYKRAVHPKLDFKADILWLLICPHLLEAQHA
jgi:hypothetical protein